MLGPLDLGLGHFGGSLEFPCLNKEEILADSSDIKNTTFSWGAPQKNLLVATGAVEV